MSDVDSVNASVAADPHVSALIEEVRRKLVDTGTRNRLVHVNRAGRGRFLNIVNERADDVFRILHTERRKMRFHASSAAPDDEEESGDGVHFDDVDLVGFQGVGELDESRFTDRLLDTNLGTDALQKRLLQLARDARTAEEEQGINILFLALGFLRWFEDEKSELPREAPLVLVPVELVRNERSSTYDIRAREEDIVTNLPLQSRLREDFGLTLPEIDGEDEWLPSAYFNMVGDALAGKPRWRIDHNGIQLGFFSFAKQLMQRDLEQAEWPEGGLAEDATIRGLLHAGFKEEPSLFQDGQQLDGLLSPQDIVQVIEADAPQTKVIEEVRRGRHLVVQGPPGTGKSQTITNIIAAAAHDGKTVLFMAEKMAALDVVLNRLRKCGLGDLCLELHSRHANKREVLQEIGRTLQSREEEPPPGIDATELRVKRDELNRIADLLHRTIEDRDYTPFEAMADVVGFIANGRKPPDLAREGLGELDTEQRRQIERDLAELADLLSDGPRPQHPFAGCRELDLQPVALQRLERELTEAVNALDDALSAGVAFARGGVGDAPESSKGEAWLPRPGSVADLRRSARFLALIGDRPQRAPQILDAVFGKELAPDLAESLEIGGQWAKAKQDAEHEFQDHAWEVPAAAARSLQKDFECAVGGLKSFLFRLGGRYRRARRTLAELAANALPDSPADCVELAKSLADVRGRRRKLADDEGFLAQHLGAAWRGERTDFHGLRSAALWIAEVEATHMARSTTDLERAESAFAQPAKTAKEIDERAEAALAVARTVVKLLRLDLDELGLGEALDQALLSALCDRFGAMAKSGERYHQWRRIQKLVEQLAQVGLGELIRMLDQGRLAPRDAVDEFRYASAESRWELAKDSMPDLSGLADLNRHEVVAAFAALESKYIENVQELIRSRHLARLPLGAVGEMGVIRSEIARKRRHMPIRRLMEKAGGMVQRIKPVFLMSPISIAQFLPPRALRFDLLVVDEASQVRPEDALGAIARCGQIVIVGDHKQLPPTSFFDRLGADEPIDEEDGLGDGIAAATEMESILTLCEARGINQRMLEWHYRSRDPSLIRISNEEFYHTRLILPPSPLELDRSYGLSFERVPGVYAARGSGVGGRSGTNRVEAEQVVRAVAAHARERPGMSLGIVTFSKAQADMVTELLEHERRQDEVLNDFLREGHAEDAFVKNIENVQGDERDLIFISVGYGPAEPGGRLRSMRFGPVNAEGGERRLNVLFTRARARCRIFASFDPGDMDLTRTSRIGPRVLKRFLDFAQTGEAVEHAPSGRGFGSPFEEDVANVIRSLGYLADPQVGSAGFWIDLGVRHPDSPGKYVLAVECDGAAYHSALSARERDRHRQAVLEGMGWKFHRIWSTDWFHRRSQEQQRLAQALADARAGRVRVPGANDGGRRAEREDSKTASGTEGQVGQLSLPEVTAPPYRKCSISVAGLEPQAATAGIVDLVGRIVAVEGPIHVNLVARRVAESFGKRHAGGRIWGIAKDALHKAQQEPGSDLLERDGFWMTHGQSERIPVRNRAAAGGGADKAAMLPPMEIVAAADLIQRESGRVERADLIRAVSRLLGFKRTGSDLGRVIGAALDGPQ